MEIQHLPNEVLIKIVGYLLNKNIKLSLNKHLLENIARLKSIEDTDRKISKVAINFDRTTENEVATVISIITKFSENIKYLKISGKVCESAFRAILSLVSNVEQLTLLEVRFLQRNQRNESNYEVLKLCCLKTLKLLRCDYALQTVLFRLPPGVLAELRLARGFHLHELIENGVFEQQKNIKNLTMVSYTDVKCHVTADFLDNLQLESFAYKGKKIENIETALSRQSTLKSLSWQWDVYPRDYPIHQNLITVAAKHLTKLEKLSVPIRSMQVAAFVNIGQLTKLKHLSIEDYEPETFLALTRLDNSRITTLKFAPTLAFLPLFHIYKLAKSVPNLRELTFCETNDWMTVLKAFNSVESLTIYVDGPCRTAYINQKRSVNPKLTELKINCYNVSYVALFEKLIADYPNLRKLSTCAALGVGAGAAVGSSFTSSAFRLIVDGFQKLESLSLHYAWELTLDDFYYLRDHKRNLTFVSLRYVNRNLIANHMTDIESIFNLVNVSEQYHLCMADDGYTMSNEKS